MGGFVSAELFCLYVCIDSVFVCMYACVVSVDVVTYRFPAGLKQRLKDAARGAGRSANDEVVARLERSFGHETAPSESAPVILRRDDPGVVPSNDVFAGAVPVLESEDILAKATCEHGADPATCPDCNYL